MKVCVQCGGSDFKEVNSSLMGSLRKCKGCGLKTPYGASGVAPVKHPKAANPEQIRKEAKAKVKLNEERGITDTKPGE